MCELFGVSSAVRITANPLLREFFSHSPDHPNGWGMAIFHGNAASVEKEPEPAAESRYLRRRLSHKVEVSNMIAHIRLATIGTMEYENCHPFVLRDRYDRCWTLAHNGTMFDCPALNPYLYVQEGRTDSERILCYFVDQLDRAAEQAGQELTAPERFTLLDELVCGITLHNKVNLLFYDGEQMYVHTNCAGTLYVSQGKDTALFSTVPLNRSRWEPVPMNTLLAYRNGRLAAAGTDHGHEYVFRKEDMELLFLDFASL